MTTLPVTGLSATGLQALHDRIEREVQGGHVSAAQLAIGLHGQVASFRSFGAANDDSRFVIFSATKALVAMALLPHFADGSLELTRPVAHYLPEFGHHGKDDVTVLQLLTMQGGFPQAPMGPAQWGTSAGRRAAFATWRLDWPAGSRTEYHPVAAHWVIAELLESLNGRSYIDVVHERVTRPAGVAAVLGPEAAATTPVTIRTTGSYPQDRSLMVATYGRDDLVPVESIGWRDCGSIVRKAPTVSKFSSAKVTSAASARTPPAPTRCCGGWNIGSAAPSAGRSACSGWKASAWPAASAWPRP